MSQTHQPENYYVVHEDSDTRILAIDDPIDGETVFATWEEARAEAVRYLNDLIEGCGKTLAELESITAPDCRERKANGTMQKWSSEINLDLEVVHEQITEVLRDVNDLFKREAPRVVAEQGAPGASVGWKEQNGEWQVCVVLDTDTEKWFTLGDCASLNFQELGAILEAVHWLVQAF